MKKIFVFLVTSCLLAPILNAYGFSGVGWLDIILIASLPFAVFRFNFNSREYYIVLSVFVFYSLLLLFNGFDLIGFFQSFKVLLYIVSGLVIRQVISENLLVHSAKIALFIVFSGFLVQFFLSLVGIYESMVFHRLGLINTAMENSHLIAYTSGGIRYSSFFLEPSHLSYWAILISGVFIATSTLNSKRAFMILFMLFMSGSSFGFGFGVLLLAFIFRTKLSIRKNKKWIVLSAPVSLLLVIFILFNSSSADYQKQLEAVPQLDRLLNEKQVVDGRTSDYDYSQDTISTIILGKGLYGTSGFIPYIEKMYLWGGCLLLLMKMILFNYLIYQGKKVWYLHIALIPMALFSGILSTALILTLFFLKARPSSARSVI
ncbi:hypothetical protein E2K93_01530 [Thalassotalea sp. HSM 43]|uniref:hypothetical protein n=1 Tax=Thalassotalea sp. HSM 43 TaxID=2552945 RepID=UPI0010802608|nr:hypothetical protein [Thalassotalea sp. HSM 43]QBY03128.1 hypothetical protein E2K93_01530 [Thalassotalea sp. HSM 43]